MSLTPQPEGLAEVLRQLVALGNGPSADERPVEAGGARENEPDGEKVESDDRMSGISPLMSFTAGSAGLDSEPHAS